MNIRPLVLKYLLIAYHPVPIENEEQGGKLHLVQKVLHQPVIQFRRQLHDPRYDIPLTDPLIYEIDGGEDEEDWHAEAVHECDEDYGEDLRLPRMQNIIPSKPQILQLMQRILMRIIWILAVEQPHDKGDD